MQRLEAFSLIVLARTYKVFVLLIRSELGSLWALTFLYCCTGSVEDMERRRRFGLGLGLDRVGFM